MKAAILPLATVLTLTGCSSGANWVKNTPEGAKVRVTSNPTVVTGCTFLGNVTGTGFYGPDESIVIVQNKTAELKGDTVFVAETDLGGLHGRGLRGEAYLCKQGPIGTIPP